MLPLLLIVSALAHPGADERRLPDGCDDVAQMFRRSAALSAESRLDEAEGEIHKASGCGADPAEVALALADLAVRGSRPAFALSLLEQITSAEHPMVHVVRSDALAALDQPSLAADSRLLAIAQLDLVTPDLSLRTAQLLEAARRLPEALSVLDHGLGDNPSPALQLEAIQVARQLNPERALARLEQLPETPTLAQMRAEILADLDRPAEAKSALRDALALAEKSRPSPKQRELVASLTLAIEGLRP